MDKKQDIISGNILILGAPDAPVGKRSLMRRLLSDKHEGQKDNYGIIHDGKDAVYGNKKIRMNITVETSKMHLANKIQNKDKHYKKADLVLLVFDATNPNSLSGLIETIKRLKQYAPDTPMVLVATKSDLTNKIAVTQNDINDFCKKNTVEFVGMLSSENEKQINSLNNILLKKIVRIKNGAQNKNTLTKQEPKAIEAEQSKINATKKFKKANKKLKRNDGSAAMDHKDDKTSTTEQDNLISQGSETTSDEGTVNLERSSKDSGQSGQVAGGETSTNQTSSAKKEIKLCKVAIISAPNKSTGKSNVVSRLCGEDFSIDYTPSFGVTPSVKEMDHNNEKVKIQFYEYGSDKRFEKAPIRDQYQQFILTYDLTDKSSLKSLDKHIKEINRCKPEEGDPVKPILLVGTKSDLGGKIQVSKEDIEEFCYQQHIPIENHHFWVSSQTGDGIDALKQTMLENAVNPEICLPETKNKESVQPATYTSLSQKPDINKALSLLQKERGHDDYAKIIETIKNKIGTDENSIVSDEYTIKDIKQDIKKLQWTMGSMLNTGANATLGFVSCVLLIGIYWSIKDYLKPETDPKKGRQFAFINAGLKQKVEAAVESHLEEKTSTKSFGK